MATIELMGNTLGTPLQKVLEFSDIQPGAQASYEMCKLIYTYHPFGAKLVEKPIKLAQSQAREIKIPTAPDDVRDKFLEGWEKFNVDKRILNTAGLARVYGISSIGLMVKGEDHSLPVDLAAIWDKDIEFNVFDPLNTAGSLVLNQNPLAMDFQHTTPIRVQNKTFHPSRTCVLMNESPIYIQYESAGFGFVGRSVYQRSLFPLKSFLQTMQTDDLVSAKAGAIVAKLESPGSVVDNLMQRAFGLKRTAIKIAQTGNVLSIGKDETIESLNLQNIDASMKTARENIIRNIATAANMPALLLIEETLAQGFGEGSEDAKAIATYVDDVRKDLHTLYAFFDKIMFYRAINPEFYKTIQAKYPREYGNKDFATAFYEWWNSFTATWPNLLKEPDSELIKVEDVQMKSALGAYEAIRTDVDQETKADMIMWLVDQLNERRLLFGGAPLVLDRDRIASFQPMEAMGNEDANGDRILKPARADSVHGARADLDESLARLRSSHRERHEDYRRGPVRSISSR